jgi:hypothetical protein
MAVSYVESLACREDVCILEITDLFFEMLANPPVVRRSYGTMGRYFIPTHIVKERCSWLDIVFFN